MPATAVIIDAVNRGREFLEGTTLGGDAAMMHQTCRGDGRDVEVDFFLPDLQRVRRQREAEGACKDANGTGISGTELPESARPPSRSDSRTRRDSRTTTFRRNSTSS